MHNLIEILNTNFATAIVGILGTLLGWFLGILTSNSEYKEKSKKVKRALIWEMRVIIEELREKQDIILGKEIIPTFKYIYPNIFDSCKEYPIIYSSLGSDISFLSIPELDVIRKFFNIRSKLSNFNLKEINADEQKRELCLEYINELIDLGNNFGVNSIC